jgi:putative membrane protein
MKQKAFIAIAFLVAFAGCREKAGQAVTETTDTAAQPAQNDTIAANTTASSGGNSSNMSNDDKEFVSKAGMGGMAEVQMGNVAAQNTANADVKAFGQKMVADHSKANEELQALATAKGLALPTELSGEQKKMMKHFGTLAGEAFDKAYMKDMVEDHEKDVAEFEKASQNAQDPDIKAWAAKTLPTLQEHLALAKTINGKLR